MLKHRGFPGRLSGTDFQFVIRRANMKAGASKLVRRERFRDRKPEDKKADAGFMAALWACFGDEIFERGNLDAGRLSWLLGREVVPVAVPRPSMISVYVPIRGNASVSKSELKPELKRMLLKGSISRQVAFGSASCWSK